MNLHGGKCIWNGSERMPEDQHQIALVANQDPISNPYFIYEIDG